MVSNTLIDKYKKSEEFRQIVDVKKLSHSILLSR
jgi:hypothetical protein